MTEITLLRFNVTFRIECSTPRYSFIRKAEESLRGLLSSLRISGVLSLSRRISGSQLPQLKSSLLVVASLMIRSVLCNERFAGGIVYLKQLPPIT